jgi:NADH-quinone oxidoreductase subunit M
MPIYSIILFICIISNFGFPGTLNFVGELLIIYGGLFISNLTILFCTFSLIITLVYTLFFYNKIVFGRININFFRFFCEITRLEFYIFFMFIFFLISLGIFPNFIFKNIIIFLIKFLIIV